MSDSRQPPPQKKKKILTKLKALIEKLQFCHFSSYSKKTQGFSLQETGLMDLVLCDTMCHWRLSFSDEHYFGHKKAIKRPWGQSITPRASCIRTWYNTMLQAVARLRNIVILKTTVSMDDCLPWKFHDAKTQNSFRFEKTLQSDGLLPGFLKKTSWWFQPIWKILVKMGISSQIGMKIKNIWNHHLEKGSWAARTPRQGERHEENTPLALKKKGLLLLQFSGRTISPKKNATLQNDDWGKPPVLTCSAGFFCVLKHLFLTTFLYHDYKQLRQKQSPLVAAGFVNLFIQLGRAPPSNDKTPCKFNSSPGENLPKPTGKGLLLGKVGTHLKLCEFRGRTPDRATKLNFQALEGPAAVEKRRFLSQGMFQ